MRLEKWALIRRETDEDTGGLVLPQDYSKVRSHGLGDSYERPHMEDGSTITTSKVVELTEDKLVTRSGSEYKLGEMHPDYASFIAAYEKEIYARLQARLGQKNSPLAALLDKTALENLKNSADATWFGQLMAKAQLFAWLYQTDLWLSKYGVEIEI